MEFSVNNRFKESSVSATPSRLSTATMDDRNAIFDPDGRFAEDIAEAWQVVSDGIEACLSNASAVMKRNANVRAIIQNGDKNRLSDEGLQRTINKFTTPINDDWVEYMGNFAEVSIKLGLSTIEVIAAIHSGYEALTERAVEKLQHDPEKLIRVIRTIGRLEALETEAIMTRVSSQTIMREREILQGHAAELEGKALNLVKLIAQSSQALREETRHAAQDSQDMLKDSTVVASASQQSTAAMQETAQLIGQLASTIEHIQKDIDNASKIADRANEQTAIAKHSSTTLTDSANAIEAIVDLIRNIASQTNLLALNATIEAARAGDAGRGFSVVASEVKSLANQTASATDDIAKQISAVQSAIDQSVQAAGTVNETIATIHDNADTVLSKIDGQMTAIVSITSAVEETTQSAVSIAYSISEVRSAAERVVNKLTAISQSTEEIDTKLLQLQNDLEDFRQTLIAA
ncbi:MAG: methyl-accepting chemotaxis protein [Sphingorhabdus sp.]